MRFVPFVVLVACGTPSAPPTAPPHQPPLVPDAPPAPPAVLAAPPAPGLRLDSPAKPTHYVLDLRIDPTKDTFAGKVTIALAVGEPIGGLWLNGADLTIDHAMVRAAGKTFEAKPIAPTPATTEAQVIGFAFDQTLAAGTAELEIEYTGKVYNAELSGIHRMEDRGTWYTYTHFESIDARRAFPSFDEPSFKVPFAITIHTPGDLAVSNTFPAPGYPRADGAGKVFAFAETKPLPTYLVAFAVGPFEIVDAGSAGKNHTPIRIITTKGRTADAAYAAKTTPEIVTRLEDYFGIPYPYDKLDQIAEPRRGGAMENAGLITVGQQALLIPAAEETIARKRRFASLAAHEIAHHWFGDLVTLAWWDDIWLNEAFASWMANKLMQEFQPTWGYDVSAVENRSTAMSGDLLPSTRRVREPITSRHDIGAAFDNMTYGKGSAVIAMFEHYVGPVRFRAAVHDYLTKHAHGVANNADFMAALSAQQGRNMEPIADHFLGWAGYPLLTATAKCDGRVIDFQFSQTRYVPLGTTLDMRPFWEVPVCLKWGDQAVDGHDCVIIDRTSRLTASVSKCPTWVHVNDGQLGYYRTAYTKPEIEKLLRVAPKLFTRPERIGLYGDLAALVDADKLPVTVALEAAPKLAGETDRFLIQTASGYLGYLGNEVVPKNLRANRARLVNKLFGARARAAGWVAAKAEDDDKRLLRPLYLSWVAHTGEDPATIKQAKQLADSWLGDRAAIDPDLVGLALGIAARFGDRAFFDRLHAAAKIEKERRDRGQMLAAMGAFRDPTIVREAMALALSDEFPAYESVGLVWGAFNEDTREIAYKFVKEHHTELLARLPRDYSFIGIAGQFCDAAHRDDAKAFLEPKIANITNGPRSLAQTLERVDICIARKAAQQKPIAAFLSKY